MARQAKQNGELLPTHPDFYRTPSVRRRLTRKAVQSRIYGKNDEDYVGFATLPDQVHRKAVKRGFDFTIMVVGESGLGKSTLMNSLFLTDLYKDRHVPRVEERITQTTKIEKKTLEIEEKGVKLRLTVVDTPGFNDGVNGHESCKPIIDYMDGQFEQYFQDETGLNRKNIQDNRIHCCIYFISPYGHGLRQIDVEMMRQLHTRVNIVPVIAKADCLTHTELRKLKARVLSEIEEHDIHIYEFPDCDSDEDEDFKQQDRELKQCIPFSVVGCNSVVEVNGKRIRGRVYPWGIVEVDNPKHCDFGQLRQMLISTHMQDLKDVTVDVHYETYRAKHIAAQMSNNQRERGKLKRDSAANLEALEDTEKLLAQKEAEIQRMHAMLAKMQVKLEDQSSGQPRTPNGSPHRPPPQSPQRVINGVRRY